MSTLSRHRTFSQSAVFSFRALLHQLSSGPVEIERRLGVPL